MIWLRIFRVLQKHKSDKLPDRRLIYGEGLTFLFGGSGGLSKHT